MDRLLRRDDAPLLLIEANGHMLTQYGKEPQDIIASLERYGYRCFLIDSRSHGCLVPVGSTDLQPECVADYLAFKSVPAELAPWYVGPPFDRSELVQRIIRTTTTRDDYHIHRSYGERVLAAAPEWVLEDAAIQELQHGLRSSA